MTNKVKLNVVGTILALAKRAGVNEVTVGFENLSNALLGNEHVSVRPKGMSLREAAEAEGLGDLFEAGRQFANQSIMPIFGNVLSGNESFIKAWKDAGLFSLFEESTLNFREYVEANIELGNYTVNKAPFNEISFTDILSDTPKYNITCNNVHLVYFKCKLSFEISFTVNTKGNKVGSVDSSTHILYVPYPLSIVSNIATDRAILQSGIYHSLKESHKDDEMEKLSLNLNGMIYEYIFNQIIKLSKDNDECRTILSIYKDPKYIIEKCDMKKIENNIELIFTVREENVEPENELFEVVILINYPALVG